MSEPTTIRLRVGEEHLVPLKGRGSAGYVWQSKVESSEPDVATVQIDREEIAEPAGQPGGLSVDYTARIRAVRPGSATIHFVLLRPWEQSVEPIRRIDLSLEVT